MWVYVTYRGGPAHGHRAWTLLSVGSDPLELVRDDACYTIRESTIRPHDDSMSATYVYDPRR